MLIAVTAMFLQQTCGSIARALPAVLAPLIIAELHANATWVGIYFSLTAFAGLIGRLHHPAWRHSHEPDRPAVYRRRFGGGSPWWRHRLRSVGLDWQRSCRG